MLEEILKSIDTNLEKIANAMEESVKPIEVSAGTITESAARWINNTLGEITDKRNIQNAESTTLQNAEVTAEVSAQAPIPTTQESFTQEQLARAMSNAVSAGKMNVILGILGQFNVQALTQINPADYNKLAAMLKEAGVEI